MSATGIIDIPSKYSVAESLNRLEMLLRSKGIKIFARIDQAAEAEAVGLELPPTQLLIFGDPRAGTPLMREHPSMAMDLPLKVLARQEADGKVLLSYNSPEYLRQRHDLPVTPFAAVASLIKAAAE